MHEFKIFEYVHVKMPGGEEFTGMVYGYCTDGISYMVKNLPGEEHKYTKIVAGEWISLPTEQVELIKKVREAGL